MAKADAAKPAPAPTDVARALGLRRDAVGWRVWHTETAQEGGRRVVVRDEALTQPLPYVAAVEQLRVLVHRMAIEVSK